MRDSCGAVTAALSPVEKAFCQLEKGTLVCWWIVACNAMLTVNMLVRSMRIHQTSTSYLGHGQDTRDGSSVISKQHSTEGHE